MTNSMHSQQHRLWRPSWRWWCWVGVVFVAVGLVVVGGGIKDPVSDQLHALAAPPLEAFMALVVLGGVVLVAVGLVVVGGGGGGGSTPVVTVPTIRLPSSPPPCCALETYNARPSLPLQRPSCFSSLACLTPKVGYC